MAECPEVWSLKNILKASLRTEYLSHPLHIISNLKGWRIWILVQFFQPKLTSYLDSLALLRAAWVVYQLLLLLLVISLNHPITIRHSSVLSTGYQSISNNNLFIQV